MKRWLTTAELGDMLAKRDARVAKLSRWHRAQYARRLVRRAQAIDGLTCIRHAGRRLRVDMRIVESLLPPDAATIDRIDVEFGALNQGHRQLKTQANSHGSLLRDHSRRIKILERKEAITTQYLRDLAKAETET